MSKVVHPGTPDADTGFALDTSGRVAHPNWTKYTYILWSDLDPFTQGYVEALFASAHRACEPCVGNGEIVTDEDRYLNARDGDKGDEGTADCPSCEGRGGFDLGGFSDLAPETLAAILKDCAAYPRLFSGHEPSKYLGSCVWADRQNGVAAEGFPTLTPYLGDDGKVYLRAAA